VVALEAGCGRLQRTCARRFRSQRWSEIYQQLVSTGLHGRVRVTGRAGDRMGSANQPASRNAGHAQFAPARLAVWQMTRAD